jgi:hypothetical protein
MIRYLLISFRVLQPESLIVLSPPPDILFETVYAGFVLAHFGTECVRDRIAT